MFSRVDSPDGVNKLGAAVSAAPFNEASGLSAPPYSIDFGTQKWNNTTKAMEWTGARKTGNSHMGVTIPGSQASYGRSCSALS